MNTGGNLADLVLELTLLRSNIIRLQTENAKTISGQLSDIDAKGQMLEGMMQQVTDLTKKIYAIQKGDKGDVPVVGIDFAQPKDGYSPIKGRDYFDGEDGDDGKTPIEGVDFIIPEPIKPPTAQEIIDFLLKLPPGKRFTINHIDGLREAIEQHDKGNQTRQRYLHGSGVPSLTAGTNITLTPTSDGGYIISSTGSSSGGSGGFSFETPMSGSINGINTVFVFAHTPAYIVVNQQTYFNGLGYALSGNTATFDFAPVSNSNITSAYRSTSVSAAVRYFDEIPSGSGTAFTLAHTPIAGSVQLYRGGGRITVSNGDYTISGTGITLARTLALGETLTADYYSAGAGTAGSSAFDEIPSGSGTAFMLAAVPIAGSVRLFRGGARISVANGDYTISGANITLTNALQTGETLTADYDF